MSDRAKYLRTFRDRSGTVQSNPWSLDPSMVRGRYFSWSSLKSESLPSLSPARRIQSGDMKHAPRLLALTLTLCATVFCGQSQAQTSSQPKCDGTSDDTSAIQSAINTATARHEKLQLPAGTCLTNATAILLPDNTVLQGAGKTTTVIRRKDSADAKTNMFTLVGKTGTVTITDLTIDYNRSHQATGSDTIGTSATTITNFTLQRTRLINSWNLALGFRLPSGTFPFQHPDRRQRLRK